MAQQILDRGMIWMQRPMVYKEVGPLMMVGDFAGEQDKLMRIINKNNDNIYRALRSTQNLVNEALDGNGDIKKQISSKQMKKNSLSRVHNFERGSKAFVTDIMWQTSNPGGGAGLRLEWAGNGNAGNAGNIYWADSPFVIIVNAGNVTLSASQTYYIYVSPREILYNITPAPPYFANLAITQTPSDAIKDGRIVLCIARRTGRGASPIYYDMPWRHQIYAGGLNPKV